MILHGIPNLKLGKLGGNFVTGHGKIINMGMQVCVVLLHISEPKKTVMVQELWSVCLNSEYGYYYNTEQNLPLEYPHFVELISQCLFKILPAYVLIEPSTLHYCFSWISVTAYMIMPPVTTIVMLFYFSGILQFLLMLLFLFTRLHIIAHRNMRQSFSSNALWITQLAVERREALPEIALWQTNWQSAKSTLINLIPGEKVYW